MNLYEDKIKFDEYQQKEEIINELMRKVEKNNYLIPLDKILKYFAVDEYKKLAKL